MKVKNIKMIRSKYFGIGAILFPFIITGAGQTCAQTYSSTLTKQVGIITGQVGGEYINIGRDLYDLIDDRSDGGIRVLSILGRGSAGNIIDLFQLRGLDFALTGADVLYETIRRKIPLPVNVEKIGYVARLYDSHIHILVSEKKFSGSGFSICNLDKMRVNTGGEYAGTTITARLLLDEILGIHPIYSNSTSTKKGIAELKKSSENNSIQTQDTIDAVIFVGGPATEFFKKDITKDEAEKLKLKLLPFSLKSIAKGCPGRKNNVHHEALRYYGSSQLTSDNYNNLIRPGEQVDTVTVPNILAGYQWTTRTNDQNVRYLQSEQFVQTFFERAHLLIDSSKYSPVWCEPDPKRKVSGVDLSRDVDGLDRIRPAQQWISKNYTNIYSIQLKCNPGDSTSLTGKISCDLKKLESFKSYMSKYYPTIPPTSDDYLSWYSEFDTAYGKVCGK